MRRFVSGRTRAEVSRKLEALRREAAAGYPSSEPLGAYLERWLVAVKPRLRPATWRSYAQHVRDYWTPGLGAITLTRLTPSHVEGVMARMLETGRSAATVQRARATLRRALHDAQRDGLVNRNVAALARPPRVERREMQALTPDEVRPRVQQAADRLAALAPPGRIPTAPRSPTRSAGCSIPGRSRARSAGWPTASACRCGSTISATWRPPSCSPAGFR